MGAECFVFEWESTWIRVKQAHFLPGVFRDLIVPSGRGEWGMWSRVPWPVWTVEQDGSPKMVGGFREKWWIKEWERMEEEIWKDWREDERWPSDCSFDPSLSDALFNVLTETTWGTPREVVCLFISAQGRGITRLWRAVSLIASTLGWLKDADGPLPQSVSVFAEFGGPAVWCQRKKAASISDTRDAREDNLLFHRSHHGIVDGEELSPQVSLFSAGVWFRNALTHLLFFVVLHLR